MPGSPFARSLRKESTWAEKLMWRWLRDRRFTEYKFRRQYPIGEYFLDFFCCEATLSIELDGSQHGFPEGQSHDAARRAFLEKKGIKELRFWNSELRRNEQAVKATIFRELQERAPHPLPPYVRPECGGGPHPGPLPKGEGEAIGHVSEEISQYTRASLGERKTIGRSQRNYRNTPQRPPIPPLPLGEGRGEGPRRT